MIRDLTFFVIGVATGAIATGIFVYAWAVSSLTQEDLQP